MGSLSPDQIQSIGLALFVVLLMVSALLLFIRRFDQLRRREAYFKAVASKSMGSSAKIHAAVRSRERSALNEVSRRKGAALDLISPAAIKNDMRRAGLPGQPVLVLLVSVVLAWLAAVVVVAAPIFSIWSQALALFPFMFLFVRKGIVGTMYNSKKIQMLDQLIGFIEHVQRSVTVGTSPDIAVVEAIEETPMPLREYLGSIGDLIEIGYDFVEAISMAADRVDLPEFDIFAASLSAQASSGGPIGAVLGEVATIARMRLDLQRKVLTLTAEGKFNAFVLGSLPIGLSMYLRNVQPDYFNVLWNGNAAGPVVYFATLILAVAGAWLAIRISAIKV